MRYVGERYPSWPYGIPRVALAVALMSLAKIYMRMTWRAVSIYRMGCIRRVALWPAVSLR